MTRPISAAALGFVFCLASTGPASATPIVWTFSGPATGTLLTLQGEQSRLVSFTNEPLVLVATFDPAANLCGVGSPSGVYRGSNMSATFMGYRYSGAAYFEADAPLGSCVPWFHDRLFRFFIASFTGTQIDPDGQRVLFYDDSSGSGTFRIFMNADPGSMPTVPPLTRQPFGSAGAFYLNGPYGDYISWNPLVTAREVPEPAAMTLVGVSLVANAIRRRRGRSNARRSE
jgi:hypothetical protein